MIQFLHESRTYVAALGLLGVAALMPQVACAGSDFGQIHRGRALVEAGDCASCHTAENGKPFAGGRPIETPFGVIYSSNITPDADTGIGSWTGDQFYRAMHEGISADGTHLYPAFPYPWFTEVTRSDVDAIFAYLRTLPAVRQRRPDNEFPWPLNEPVMMKGWNALYFDPGTYKPDRSKSAEWNRGAYLVKGLGHCGACHTPRNALGAAERSHAFEGAETSHWYAPPLDGDKADGLGNWTSNELVRFLKTGHADKTVAFGPMAEVVTNSTSRMSDADIKAMAVYLKSLPAQRNRQESASKPSDSAQAIGKAIYADTCSACHGLQGEGTAGLFPTLKDSSVVQSDNALTVIRLILDGGHSVSVRNGRTATGMPSFGWKLSDAQIAAVASYVRSAWGNAASPVTAGDVHDLRQIVQSPSSAGQ